MMSVQLIFSSCIRGRLLEVNEAILSEPDLLLEKVTTSTALKENRWKICLSFFHIYDHMCELCVLFWHSLPQRDTLQLYYLNLKRVRVSLKAFYPENNTRRFWRKETNEKSLAEINLHFEAADWLQSALKNNYFKQVETSMAPWLCATYISKNILRKFEGMKTCLLDSEQSWISLECILLDRFSWNTYQCQCHGYCLVYCFIKSWFNLISNRSVSSQTYYFPSGCYKTAYSLNFWEIIIV